VKHAVGHEPSKDLLQGLSAAGGVCAASVTALHSWKPGMPPWDKQTPLGRVGTAMAVG